MEKDFAYHYFRLTHLQKEILACYQWYARKFETVEVFQNTIAKKKGCTRKHVNESVQIFKKKFGVYVKQQGRNRAARTVLPPWLVNLDLTKVKPLKSKEVTPKVTERYSRSSETCKEKTCYPKPPIQENPLPLEMPVWLQSMPFALDDKLKMALMPESVYIEAHNNAAYSRSKGNKIYNYGRYIVEESLRIVKKREIKLNWKAYYLYTRVNV